MYKIYYLIFLIFNFYLITFVANFILRNFNLGYLLKVILSILISFSFIIIFLLNSKVINKDYYFTVIILILLNSYIYLNIVQIIISSIRVNILKIFYKEKNPQIKNKFNDKKIFNTRINRLSYAKIIKINKNKYYLEKKKILLLLSFYIFFKKIYKIKKIYN